MSERIRVSRLSCRWFSVLTLAALGCASAAGPAPPNYVFAWPFVDETLMLPRGGTTRGDDVTLDLAASPAWRHLQQPDAASRDRDRAAILALAGDYRASFDFLETVVYEPGGRPARPYRSWGTERIRVIDEREDFVSLQHLLVMFVIDDDGERQGPFVQKHWRQDWQYEPREALAFRGFASWQYRQVAPADRAGAWSQTVYQVDDSPRYAATGRWRHDSQASVWDGEDSWRPLPRREHSLRDDYDVLSGRHRITVLPTGWVHGQDNAKLIIDASTGTPSARRALEIGVSRYERIRDFDFSAGEVYWQATGPYWRLVRAGWTSRAADPAGFTVASHCGDEPAYAPFFRLAERVAGGEALSEAAQRGEIERILDCLLKPAEDAPGVEASDAPAAY